MLSILFFLKPTGSSRLLDILSCLLHTPLSLSSLLRVMFIMICPYICHHDWLWVLWQQQCSTLKLSYICSSLYNIWSQEVMGPSLALVQGNTLLLIPAEQLWEVGEEHKSQCCSMEGQGSGAISTPTLINHWLEASVLCVQAALASRERAYRQIPSGAGQVEVRQHAL